MIDRRGMLYAGLAYSAWGLLPAFWKLLSGAPAMETMAHRILWALVFCLFVLTITRNWGWLRTLRSDGRRLRLLALGAALISVNWMVYIWAVNNGHVIEGSLGYFINPLLNVVIGVAFFHERMRPAQWAAIALAGAGVLYLMLAIGGSLWVSITLAITFALYGTLRKLVNIGALEGLTIETAFAAPLALAIVGYQAWTGQGSLGLHAPARSLLFMASGALTAVPLLMFAYGLKRIPLSTAGVLQYLTPTFQFLLGVLAFHEPFDSRRLIGFVIVWLALAIYSAEAFWVSRRPVSTAPVATG